MDASNPVMTSDRHTIEDLLDRNGQIRRQDLGYLSTLAQTSERRYLSTSETVPLADRKAIVADFQARQTKISTLKEGDLDPAVFKVVFEDMAVCGIMDRHGTPLHPPGVNNKQGKVCVNRMFGQTPKSPLGLAQIVSVLGEDVLDVDKVYTSGTWKGFLNRLNQQMGRKTVPLNKTMSDGKPLKTKALISLLDGYMPRDPNPTWVGLTGDFYEGLTTKLKITANASAGAPYWRNKGDCLEQIVDVGLPLVLKALKEDRLNDLWMQNPEFFLVEVKNKLDRYEVARLDEKTRPYVCVPAHFAFLFSMLTQGFQETLAVFGEGKQTSNAYGFSSARGGLKRMAKWMYKADSRGKVVCYGDDACIVVKRGDKIYRIDPDFKQMDGSLDKADIDLTVDWILSHVERDLGELPPLWKGVGEVWKVMACNPHFIVDGTKIYQKTRPGGLMTGVPGTTLFDTVKSVMAWNRYLDVCARGEGDVLDEAFATRWMLKNGLVIKPGTWNPEPLPAKWNPGELLTDHKFLGVQILVVDFKGTLQCVPTIPYKDAVEMLVVQKDNPYNVRGDGAVVSRTTAARTLYDRMRGLMITMGFTIPNIQNAIHSVVNSIAPEVILMQVQNGSGERPDHVTMQDFTYPDSSGFPTPDFCMSVYSDILTDCPWTHIYPQLVEVLLDMKAGRRAYAKKYRLVLEPSTLNNSLVRAVVQETPEVPIPKEYEVVSTGKAISTKLTTIVNPRSKILQYDGQTETLRKRLPTLGEAVKLYLNSLGGITQVATAMSHFSVTAQRLRKAAEEYGFFFGGYDGWDFISLYPLATPERTVQDEVYEGTLTRKDIVGKETQERNKGIKAAQRLVKTAPELVLLDVVTLSGLRVGDDVAQGDLDAQRLLNKMLAKSGFVMRWRTEVNPQLDNSVRAILSIRHSKSGEPKLWTEVAIAASLSRALAQSYVARAILELNNVQLEESVFSVQALNIISPPSWYEDALLEENPRRAPTVFDIETPNDALENLVKQKVLTAVTKKMPHVPQRMADMMINLVASGLSPDEEGFESRVEFLLDKADRVHKWSSSESSTSGVGLSPPSSPSKRSRLSPAVKQRRNRRLLERRKAIILASRGSPKI